jgi:hypothetical protein
LEELQQEYILSIIFKNAVDREDLLVKKYAYYYDKLGGKNKNEEMLTLLKEFEDIAHEHITILKDKMIKLNIQG